MARKIYRIDQFVGIDQSQGENGMNPAFSPDACNMDTSDGDLTVAKGYTRYISDPIPGTDPIRRIFRFRAITGDQVVALAGSTLYAYKDGAWTEVYTYDSDLNDGKVDFQEVQIDGNDYLLMGSGEGRVIKYDGYESLYFGSEEKLSDVAVRYLAMYRGRLFSAGDAVYPGRLYWSKLPGSERNIEDWGDDVDSVNVSGGHTEIGTVSGEPIVGLAALSNQLIIFKKGSIYRLIGDKPSNFTVERVLAESEEAAYTSIVNKGDMLYYMTKGGMCRFNGVSAGQMGDADKLKRLMQKADVSDCRGAGVRNKLYFTLTDENGPAMVEYDTARGAYMLRRGFTPTDIASWDGELFIVDQNRYVCRFDSGSTYNGTPIEAWWRTPETDLYDKSGVKAMRSLCFRGSAIDSDTALNAEVKVGEAKTKSRIGLATDSSEVMEVPLKNEGRTFSMSLSNEAGGRFTLKGGVELSFETWRRVE